MELSLPLVFLKHGVYVALGLQNQDRYAKLNGIYIHSFIHSVLDTVLLDSLSCPGTYSQTGLKQLAVPRPQPLEFENYRCEILVFQCVSFDVVSDEF